MLVISRKAGQSFTIGDDIEIRVLACNGSKVSLGIACPKPVPIVRDNAKKETPRVEETKFSS